MKKYGFVYIWRDRKHMRFYIGCHWGTEDDGYICSSNWMRRSYRRRPDDFKRRIVAKTTKRDDLLLLEYMWLKQIHKDDLGKKYYNLTNHMNGHWTSESEKQKSIKQKISETKKKFWSSPESEAAREKLRVLNKQRGTKPPSRKGKPGWNKGLTKETDQRILNNSIAISKPKSDTKLMGRYNKYRDELKRGYK